MKKKNYAANVNVNVNEYNGVQVYMAVVARTALRRGGGDERKKITSANVK